MRNPNVYATEGLDWIATFMVNNGMRECDNTTQSAPSGAFSHAKFRSPLSVFFGISLHNIVISQKYLDHKKPDSNRLVNRQIKMKSNLLNLLKTLGGGEF